MANVWSGAEYFSVAFNREANVRRIYSFLLGLMALLPIAAIVGCAKQAIEAPAEQEIAGDITEVLDRLNQASKANPKPGTTYKILLTPPNQEEEPRWIITAKRTSPQGVTEYGMLFRRSANRWVCYGATSRETESTGAVNEHRLSGESIEIDQLIIWLGW